MSLEENYLFIYEAEFIPFIHSNKYIKASLQYCTLHVLHARDIEVNKINPVLMCLTSQSSRRTGEGVGMMMALRHLGGVQDSAGDVMVGLTQESRGMDKESEQTS